jgi:hypothetical protein
VAVMIVDDSLLAAIAVAAEGCLRFDEIGGGLGLSATEWRELIRTAPDAVALAVAQGRAQAQAKNGADLLTCSRHGKVEAALFILRRDHSWPSPAIGRPPRPKPR